LPFEAGVSQSAVRTTAVPAAAARMPLLDAVKGLACALIVGHHLARYGPLPAGASTLAPGLFEWLAEDGRLAVQVFLVLAGFLAAGSLAPDGVLRIERPMLRVFQRYGRLVMPYLAALCVSVLAAALVRPWLMD
jgi:peptidoglycan/LPS O-acetylase OafA/YrhL